MRVWPDKSGSIRLVLRQVLPMEEPFGELVMIGGPQDRMEGRARLLQGLATTLGPVLARLRMAASVAEAVDALAGDIVVVADVGGRWAPTSGEATVSGWDLSLVGRLLRASRVTALIPTATGACRYVEWPGEDSEPARVAARESLTRLLPFNGDRSLRTIIRHAIASRAPAWWICSLSPSPPRTARPVSSPSSIRWSGPSTPSILRPRERSPSG